MEVLTIFAAYEHISDLMAEAESTRRARGDRPKRGIRSFVASLFGGRGTGQAPVRSALANT